MNSGFVNRLVGTSIIVIAAIVFIPNILDGEKVHYKEGFKQIPERPDFTSIDLQESIDDRASLALEPKEDVIEDVVADDLNDADSMPEVADGKTATAETVANEADLTESSETTEQVVQVTKADTQKPVEEVAKAASESSDEQPEPKPVTATVKAEPKLERPESSNFTKMAYVIQLGSFSHQANVLALTDKLKKNGFKTFTRPVKTPNGTLTKVFVGPDLNKQKLEAKLPELKKLTKLNGRLTQFKVAN
ncbi:SPOR domain-containing protein [Pseudoalteromonas luteoviolacea]|uniref:SPOR domain-containing protein n=1 Tax=Pseudoalteromonas luteoviolacea TaxID=43657 RepID=UPI001B38B2BA|nr:SPOR domain-containing protein [Pseudoalteromonas luteoviolacea]MBQ4814394.1 SPOR domain-containing protein [Pseudoalteromonas luteoviolacea]